jgi:hypothetical protein
MSVTSSRLASACKDPNMSEEEFHISRPVKHAILAAVGLACRNNSRCFAYSSLPAVKATPVMLRSGRERLDVIPMAIGLRPICTIGIATGVVASTPSIATTKITSGLVAATVCKSSANSADFLPRPEYRSIATFEPST